MRLRLQAARIDWRDGTELPFLGDTVILVLDTRTTGAVLDNGADGLPGVARRLLRIGLPHTATPEQIPILRKGRGTRARRPTGVVPEHRSGQVGIF